MKRLFVEAPLPIAEAARWATDEERAAANHFATARQREYFAWRAIVRRAIGRDAAIAYNAVGAPILTNYPFRITVSHCQGRVAVGISDRPCAVDIERIDRHFRRILSRYLSPEEQRLSAHPLFPAIAWCAKETLYKYAGRQGLDLLNDLHIDRLSFSEAEARPTLHEVLSCPVDREPTLHRDIASDQCCGTLLAHCTGTAPKTLYFYRTEEFIVVFLFE